MQTSEIFKHSYAIILAGGGGTRLWPKSRKSSPKHFIKIVGDNTMLQTTFKRTETIFPKERILIITTQDQLELVKKQLPNLPKDNIITEPFPNNTALAMGTAAAFVYKRDVQGVLIYFAADHLIENQKKLKEAVLCSLDIAANTPNIVAVAIRPTFAHTGLGYIKVGDQFGKVTVDGEEVYAFACRGFKEKPNLATAQAFFASGQYLWNANIYCWAAKTLFKAFENHSPNLSKSIQKMLSIIGTQDEAKNLRKIYETAENIQIDYAVSEKAKNIVVVPGEFDWNDIGDWKVVYDISQKDDSKNVISGEIKNYLDYGSQNCLIETNGRLVATVGLKDIVIIDTEDALLVCHKDQAQDVKKIVERLKIEKKAKYL